MDLSLKRLFRALIPGQRQPSTQPIYPDISQAFSSIVTQAHDVLVNPDIAYRTDRQLSDQMIRDPMVMGPLQKRMLATAQLEWQIVPEDDTDAQQVFVAESIEKTINAIPRKVDMFRDLLWGTFRGTGATEIFWEQGGPERQWQITHHKSHHGDKFVYDIHGTPRVLTRRHQTDGRELTGPERDRLIIHTAFPEDGSFFEPAEAGYVFQGRGLRDQIWQFWWLKHNALKFWVRFMERYGGGMAIGRYPSGNKQAKDAVESVLQNLINDSMVSMPVPQEAGDRDVYGVEISTTAGAGESHRLFKEFVDDWAGHHIRLIIEGQSLTSESGPTGLGSDLARVHQDTFRMYRDYDAATVSDTLTEQLVRRIELYNHGNLPFKSRFEFVTTEDNWDQEEKRVNAAKEMGLSVPKDWAYDTLGIPIPQADDEVITLGGGGGLGGFGSMDALGGGSIFDVPEGAAGGGTGSIFDVPTNGNGRGLFAEAVGGKRKADRPRDNAGRFVRAK